MCIHYLSHGFGTVCQRTIELRSYYIPYNYLPMIYITDKMSILSFVAVTSLLTR